MRKIIALLLCLGLLCGCAVMGLTSLKVNSVMTPTKNSAEIISSPPGARVEINNEYIGTTPLYVEIDTPIYITGGVRGSIDIVAYPVVDGQYVQRKTIGDNQHIPKKIFFDMNVKPAPTKSKIDVNIGQK